MIVITTFDTDEYVHGALKAGARGLPAQRHGPDLLVQAIRAAAAGDTLIAPSVTARLLGRVLERRRDAPLQSSSRGAHRTRGKRWC